MVTRLALVATPDEELRLVTRDLADNRVLEAAIAGGAESIVTNDNDLLDLPPIESIEIVTAARFAALLSQSRQ